MDEIDNRENTADFIKIPVRTLDYLVATDQVPYSRIGKRGIRFVRVRILEWLQEREQIEYHRKNRK